MMPSNDELVTAFQDALAGNSDAFAAGLAPGAVVWHNHDRQEVDAIDNMAAVDMLSQIVDNVVTESRLFTPIDGGFLLQYVTNGNVKSNGKPFEMHNCLIVQTNADGLITRIEEYVDPTVGAQLS
jgi:ketosteroid isomerase-like protein